MFVCKPWNEYKFALPIFQMFIDGSNVDVRYSKYMEFLRYEKSYPDIEVKKDFFHMDVKM